MATQEVGAQQPPQGAPPAGWYPNPQGPGQRYWDGARWTDQYSQPQPAAQPATWRDAYVVISRVTTGLTVARVCAVGVILGLLGGLATWGDTSALFDISNRESVTATEFNKPPLGFLVGPVLIFIALPRIRGRAPKISFKEGYSRRLWITIGLWSVGLVALIVTAIVTANDGFTIRGGTYIGGTLMLVGLLGTLAMWPKDLEVVQADSTGKVKSEGAD